MNDWMRRLGGLSRTAIASVETTTASCNSHPVRTRKSAWSTPTLAMFASTSVAVSVE
jgi:hypothetical protein